MIDIRINDDDLIAGIKANDYGSYRHLYIRYYSRLCQYVYSLIQDKADAEDIIQDLFLNLWKNRGKIEITSNVSAYLYKTAKNLTLNHIRDTKKHQSLDDTDIPDFEKNQLEADEFRIALFSCIDLLPSRSKEVLLLHRIKGMKQKEIADKLTISIKTIKNQIWSALHRLRGCLEAKGL